MRSPSQLNQPMAVSLATLLALCASCATTLAPDAERVRVVTANQKEHSCESLKIVTVEQRLGPNKPGNAMKKALNEVAAAGGNGIFIVSTSTDWAEGASVVAEALKCRL